MMQNTRQVSVEQQGDNQVITIPQDFASLGSEVIVRKEGQALIIEPLQAQSLLALLAILPDLSNEGEFSDVDAGFLLLDDVML
ncbi:MAG: AbrB/MazE/SpoVT family DNA-binding domain-containing protein [Cyanobacteria bacterium J06638_22]